MGTRGQTCCCNSIHALRLAPTIPLRHISQVVALANGSTNGCTATRSRPGRLASIDGNHQQRHRERERRVDEGLQPRDLRSEEHTSELQSLMRTSYAVFCLKKKKQT